jgi:hypothetical protein
MARDQLGIAGGWAVLLGKCRPQTLRAPQRSNQSPAPQQPDEAQTAIRYRARRGTCLTVRGVPTSRLPPSTLGSFFLA